MARHRHPIRQVRHHLPGRRPPRLHDHPPPGPQLADTLYADVHEEACRWEHVMSEAVERRLLALLGNPSVSPFGNPIPGLEALRGDEPLGGETSAVLDALTVLSTTATPEGRPVVIRRISEQLQEDATLLRSLADHGVRPGVTMRARLVEGSVVLDDYPLPLDVARHMFVSAVDEELTPLEAAPLL
ncbi:metal-dependent transcriptional regulator [Blastococcus sp. TML/M2B]|uniref:metal-dependent transcriptional regulator n=1 Tax=Blastococcus sp. TML/M2B TaxID=2798727 RepID=UPI0028150FDC|nr:metal-dependent transcriptional regulator [Blastococcus sp. TML/M2B]